MNENQQNKNLNFFRAQIDEIDLKIIELLRQRMQIVQDVAKFKQERNEKFYIKSSREADMIKNLVNTARGQFPKSTIVNIWRKIITTSNMAEQPIKIAIHNPKNISDYNYIVKNYYLDEVPTINFDSVNNIVSELENNNCQIGVFAIPNQNFEQEKKEDTKENWWISLANNKSEIKIFAKIPFIEFDQKDKNFNPINLVAVAIKESEKSADDGTFICIETPKEISKYSLQNELKNYNINGKILKSVELIQFEGIRFHLIETDNFIDENNPDLKKFATAKFKPFIKILGHFAKPIII
jgi:chorismate mutase